MVAKFLTYFSAYAFYNVLTIINMNGGTMNDMTFPASLASLFNRHHKVGKDLSIDRDTQLRSYQEDIEQDTATQETKADERSDDD